jgi:hypothetical protein
MSPLSLPKSSICKVSIVRFAMLCTTLLGNDNYPREVIGAEGRVVCTDTDFLPWLETLNLLFRPTAKDTCPSAKN